MFCVIIIGIQNAFFQLPYGVSLGEPQEFFRERSKTANNTYAMQRAAELLDFDEERLDEISRVLDEDEPKTLLERSLDIEDRKCSSNDTQAIADAKYGLGNTMLSETENCSSSEPFLQGLRHTLYPYLLQQAILRFVCT